MPSSILHKHLHAQCACSMPCRNTIRILVCTTHSLQEKVCFRYLNRYISECQDTRYSISQCLHVKGVGLLQSNKYLIVNWLNIAHTGRISTYCDHNNALCPLPRTLTPKLLDFRLTCEWYRVMLSARTSLHSSHSALHPH